MSIESTSSPPPSELTRISRILTTLLVLAALVTGSTIAILRWQWDRSMAQTLAWYQDQVGPVDYRSYLPDEVADQDNLAVLLEEAATSWPDSVDRGVFSKFVAGYYDLQDPGSDPNAVAVSPSALEAAARSALEHLGPVLLPLDEMAGRTESALGLPPPWQEGSTPEWLFNSLVLARVQMTRAALDLERGDCVSAAQQAVVLERLSSVLRREPLLYAYLIGNSLESSFAETSQTLLEAELRGECSGSGSAVRVPLQQARAHLDDSRLDLSRVLAAEGSLITGWDIPRERLLERMLGKNAANYFASHLVFYAETAHGADGPFEQPPPELAAPARWASPVGTVAEMLAPNLESARNKEHDFRAADALTEFLFRLSDCHGGDPCSSPPSLPTHPVTNATASSEPMEDGLVRIWFEIQDDSTVDAARRREFSSCEVPASSLSL